MGAAESGPHLDTPSNESFGQKVLSVNAAALGASALKIERLNRLKQRQCVSGGSVNLNAGRTLGVLLCVLGGHLRPLRRMFFNLTGPSHHDPKSEVLRERIKVTVTVQ